MGTNEGYVQVNLVSDITNPNPAHVDANLVNPWGIVAGPGVVWVNDNGAGRTTSYNAVGKSFNFAINIPAPGGGAGAPSGLVLNDTAQFVITHGAASAASTFLMATEDGTITAWNHSVTGSNAVIVADNSASGAVYKGLAIALDTNGAPHLYAANFHAGKVDEYDGNFHFVRCVHGSLVAAGADIAAHYQSVCAIQCAEYSREIVRDLCRSGSGRA